jgi:hypothetical protein
MGLAMKSSRAVSHLPSAYKLACGMLGSTTGVSEVVIDAFDGIDGFLQKQTKNREDALNPTKPHFGEVEAFQYLLYEELEPAEANQERGRQERNEPLHDETMILRYLKCAVFNSINNRPYYLAVGIGSLLYEFDWQATARIHDLVIQDHDEAKTWNKKNDRLRDLKDDLIERFSELLPYAVDGRKEKKFNYRPVSKQLLTTTQAGLSLLVPWGSDHVIPEALASSDTPITGLRLGQSWSTNEDRKELEMSVWKNRSHAFIDPTCFKRLINALNLGPLDSRLCIPYFALSHLHGDNGVPPDLLSLPEPPAEFYEEFFDEREKRNRRRRNLRAKRLAIIVDGLERHQFDVEESESFHFEVPHTTKVIKIMARDGLGALLLAKLSLRLYREDLAEEGEVQVVSELKDGQLIHMRLCPVRQSEEDLEIISIAVTYKETQPVRSLSLALRRVKHRLVQSLGFENWDVTPAWKTAVAVLTLLVVVLFVVLLRRSSPTESTQEVTPSTPTPAPGIAVPSPTPNGSSAPLLAEVPTYMINDDNGIIAVPVNGSEANAKVVGLDGYSSEIKGAVLRAIDKEGRNLSLLSIVPIQREQTMGENPETKPITVEAPNGEVLRTQTPLIQWRSNLPSHRYLIKIFDDGPDKRSQPPVIQTQVSAVNEWKVTQPLERGRTYVCQVSVIPLPGETASKLPRTGEGRFKVISASELRQVADAERVRPRSHLALGVVYCKAGLLTQAEREFQILSNKNKDSKVVHNLLIRVRDARRRKAEARDQE